GLATLRLVNAGKEPHQAGLVRVDSGKSSAAVEAAMKAPGPPPAWVAFVGGPDVVLPGDTANSTQPLTAGRYFLVCFFPSPAGQPARRHRGAHARAARGVHGDARARQVRAGVLRARRR